MIVDSKIFNMMVLLKVEFTVHYWYQAISRYWEGKKIQNGWLKKARFFKIANSQKNFAKISQIRPWVSRIEWYEGHWCSSTYMAVRLCDKSSKTAKKYRKCIFWLFLSFCRTASRPYTLSFINALHIIQSY